MRHLTGSVPTEHAADISGVSWTTTQIGGAVAVAAFGTLALSFGHGGAAQATQAFTVTSVGLAAAGALAAAVSRRAMRTFGRRETAATARATIQPT